jgi:hypothetical protein
MQFVMDVMEQNAFEPEGYGLRAIQRLRLVHALIRIRIDVDKLRKTPGRTWNIDWGTPINQQDMIFAVHTFSIEVLHGLLASGEKISEEGLTELLLCLAYYRKSVGCARCNQSI